MTVSTHLRSQEVRRGRSERYSEFGSRAQVQASKLEMKVDIEEFQRRQVDVVSGSENSSIAKFYAGKYVFLTGGTGFLGKLTMEKLLRACPDLGGIFVLARPKKGKDMHCRLDDVFSEVIFENLSKLQPKFRHKITPISGDMMLPGMGLSIEDRQLITEKVNVIFHGAATVRFDEKLDVAVAINVKGTRDMLALAKECDGLESFVHVSTAFTNCVVRTVDEGLSAPPIEPDKIMAICEATPQDILNKMTPDLLGDYPNTYAFTKALGENVVAQYASGLPVCVFRPAIVISTYKEPTPCWIDNIYGPTGVVVGCGIGLLRVLHCNGRRIADIVPADMVVNSMIAASHKNAIEKKRDDIPFYNYVSSAQNPITWNKFMEVVEGNGMETPTMKSVWYYSFMMFQNKFLYMLYAFLVHTIPALLVDMVLILIGRKAQMLKVYKKIHKFNNVLTYFMQREWKFSNGNVQSLWSDLSVEDQRLFPFDMRALDWDDYFLYFTLGLRIHLIKDDISTIPAARIRFKRFKLLHRTIQALLIIVGLKLLYGILAYFLL